MDTGDIIILITCIVGGLAIIGAMIYVFAVEMPKDIEKERIRRQKVEEEYEKEPEYVFVSAKVVSARKYVYNKMDWSMPMLPGLVEQYYVTFLTEKGEEIEYPVPQELFFNLSEGEEGMLVTVNGNFFDFG